jgi:hypothetical protein
MFPLPSPDQIIVAIPAVLDNLLKVKELWPARKSADAAQQALASPDSTDQDIQRTYAQADMLRAQAYAWFLVTTLRLVASVILMGTGLYLMDWAVRWRRQWRAERETRA